MTARPQFHIIDAPHKGVVQVRINGGRPQFWTRVLMPGRANKFQFRICVATGHSIEPDAYRWIPKGLRADSKDCVSDAFMNSLIGALARGEGTAGQSAA